jgi:hypothetical protein
VIHETLRLIGADSSLAKKITGVAMLADAGRVSMAAEDTYGSVSEDVLLITRPGIWWSLMAGAPTARGPLPDWVLSRTVSLCHTNDMVCARGINSSVANHTNYSIEEISLLARQVKMRLK